MCCVKEYQSPHGFCAAKLRAAEMENKDEIAHLQKQLADAWAENRKLKLRHGKSLGSTP